MYHLAHDASRLQSLNKTTPLESFTVSTPRDCLVTYPFVVRLRASSHRLPLTPFPAMTSGRHHPPARFWHVTLTIVQKPASSICPSGSTDYHLPRPPTKHLDRVKGGPSCCSLCRSSLSSAGLSSRRFLAAPLSSSLVSPTELVRAPQILHPHGRRGALL
jgi:hypothetical protein